MPSNATDSWSYEVRGGAEAEAWRKVETSRISCVDYGKNLRKTERKRARVYGFRPTRDVWHGCRKRISPKCNARRWFNYRTRSRRKIFFEGRGRDGIVFANSGFGFDFAFVEYIQKLHFFGFPSFSAVVKSNAEICGSPDTNRFRDLLSGAFFLLRAVQEYATAGIDVNEIAVGGECAEENNMSYADHLLRRVFPPRNLFFLPRPSLTVMRRS